MEAANNNCLLWMVKLWTISFRLPDMLKTISSMDPKTFMLVDHGDRILDPRE